MSASPSWMNTVNISKMMRHWSREFFIENIETFISWNISEEELAEMLQINVVQGIVM